MPFLIIIAVGVIIVLLFNLVSSFFASPASQKAYLHIAEGSVSMKTWGTDDFFDHTSDVLVVEGDEVKTASGSKTIVEFFVGTVMRIDGGSDVVFQLIDDEDGGNIEILLVNGRIWFNKHYKESLASVKVSTGDILVTANGHSVFTVENEFDDMVRNFLNEDVVFEVLGEDGKAVDTDDVGPGQQAVFTAEALSRFRQFQSPNVVVAQDDEFKETEWYAWNIEEDKNPTEFVMMESGWQFVKAEPEMVEEEVPVDGEETEAVNGETTEETTETGEASEEETAVEIPEGVELGDLAAPTIITVSGGNQTNSDGFYVVTGNPATIRGGATGAAKIVVNGYTLSKYTPGDAEWTYFANAEYDFMQEGENTYEVYALGADGTRSESLIVKVLYQPPQAAPVVEVVGGAEDTANTNE